MNTRLPLTIGICLLLVVVVAMSAFRVDQRRFALVMQLGEIKRVETAPGLKFKLPLIQNVKYFDRRIQTMDSSEPELFQTAEKKNVLVDSFVKWHIKDPAMFYRAFGQDDEAATNRLEQTINSVLRDEASYYGLRERTVSDISYVHDLQSASMPVHRVRPTACPPTIRSRQSFAPAARFHLMYSNQFAGGRGQRAR